MRKLKSSPDAPFKKEPETGPPKKIRLYLKISAGLHVGFFVLLFLGHWLFPGRSELFQPSVQVDMVALPDTVKNQQPPPLDPTLPTKDENPPPPPKTPEPADDDDFAAPAPKKDTAAAEAKKKKTAEEEARQALKRVQDELKKKDKNEEKRRQQQVEKREDDLRRLNEAFNKARKGNQVNQGTSDTGVNQDTQNAYYGHIQQRLHANWALPAWLQSKGLRAVARIYIDGQGKIFRYHLTEASGNDAFDNYVKAAIQRASPLAAPPEEMSRGLRNQGLEVQFPL